MKKLNFKIAECPEEEILSLLNKSFCDIARSEGFVRDEEFWKWKYQDSPFGKSFVQYARIDSKVAVAGCLWPLNFIYKGQKLSALQPCDTTVDAQFRRHGLFQSLNSARLELANDLDFDFIFNFPNENSLPGYIKCGWKFLGKVSWLVRPVKPLSIIQDRLSPSRSSNISIADNFRLFETQAELLEEKSDVSESLLSLIRPFGYFKWRFALHPTRQYGVISLDKQGEGIAVFTLSQKQSGLIEMVVVEFIANDFNFQNLLNSIFQCAVEVNASFIAMMNPNSVPISLFIKKGFIPVKSKNLVFYPLKDELPVQLENLRDWNLQAALHDSI